MAAEPGVPSAPPSSPPSPSPRPSKLSAAAAPEFSLATSIGGVRGVIESVLPYTVFSLVYAFTENLQASIIAALVPVVVLVIWRLIARETIVQAVSGALVIALGAFFAQRTGEAVTFFLPNLLKNAGFAILYAISILVRWPLIGVVVGPITGEMFAWRDDPRRLAAYQRATWLWVGLFVVRLAVQVPLYLAENVTLLGTLNGTVLGVPLFALTIWLSWLVLKSVPLARTPEQRIADASERIADASERTADLAQRTDLAGRPEDVTGRREEGTGSAEDGTEHAAGRSEDADPVR
jgi:hypothetical protein